MNPAEKEQDVHVVSTCTADTKDSDKTEDGDNHCSSPARTSCSADADPQSSRLSLTKSAPDKSDHEKEDKIDKSKSEIGDDVAGLNESKNSEGDEESDGKCCDPDETEELERMLIDYETKGGLVDPASVPLSEQYTKSNPSASSSPVAKEPSPIDVAQVIEAALETGRSFASIITGKTDEMVKLSDDLLLEVKSFAESREPAANSDVRSTSKKAVAPFEFAVGMMPVLNRSQKQMPNSGTKAESKTLSQDTRQMFQNVENALRSLQKIIQELQSASIQTEVAMINQVRLITKSIERKSRCIERSIETALSNNSVTVTAPRVIAQSTSRIYTAAQLNKMRLWYKKTPRPYTNEVDAMHKVLNMYPYTDERQQPNGLSARHVRAWFDKRRALERQHYVRKIENDAKGKGLHASIIQQMKSKAVQKSKVIQERKMARLRENADPSSSVILEAEKMKTGELVPTIDTETHNTDSALSSEDDLDLESESELDLDISKKRKGGKSKQTEGPRKKAKLQNFQQPSKKECFTIKKKLDELLSGKSTDRKHEVVRLLETIALWDFASNIPTAKQHHVQLQKVIKLYRNDKELRSLANDLLKKVKSHMKSEKKGSPTKSSKFSATQVKRLETYFKKNPFPKPGMIKKIVDRLNAESNPSQGMISTKKVHVWFSKRRLERKVGAIEKDVESAETETDDDNDDNKPLYASYDAK